MRGKKLLILGILVLTSISILNGCGNKPIDNKDLPDSIYLADG